MNNRTALRLETASCAALACGLVAVVTGCGEPPLPWVEQGPRLNVVFNFRPIQDWPENVPYVRTEGNLNLKGEIRKSPVYDESYGVKYGGEKLEIVGSMTYDAAGTQIFQVVSRRFNEPEHHLDIYVDSALAWELFIEHFVGRVEDVTRGEALAPRYRFDAGKYHLKAYRDNAPAAGDKTP